MSEVLDPTPVAVPQVDGLMQIISRAVNDPAVDVAKLERLLAVKKDWEADEARKAFVRALSAFKANPPRISKNKHVAFQTSKGQTEYWHATLDNVVDVIGAALARHGLSFRWQTQQGEGGVITVSCVLTHVGGHSETTTLSGGRDESGGKNNIQAVGSTVSYLQRYTLLAATGMATSDQDDDARSAEAEPETPLISEEVADRLGAAMLKITDMAGLQTLWAAMSKDERKAMKDAKEATKLRLLRGE